MDLNRCCGLLRVSVDQGDRLLSDARPRERCVERERMAGCASACEVRLAAGLGPVREIEVLAVAATPCRCDPQVGRAGGSVEYDRCLQMVRLEWGARTSRRTRRARLSLERTVPIGMSSASAISS